MMFIFSDNQRPDLEDLEQPEEDKGSLETRCPFCDALIPDGINELTCINCIEETRAADEWKLLEP